MTLASRSRIISACALVANLAALVSVRIEAQSPATPVIPQDVKAAVVSKTNEDRIIVGIPNAKDRFDYRLIEMKEGETIRNLFYDAGIKPDGHAYTLLYLANPWLRDVDKIAAGSELWFPNAVGPTIKNNRLVAFKVFEDQRAIAAFTLRETSEAVETAAPMLRRLIPDNVVRVRVEALWDAYERVAPATRVANFAATERSLAMLAVEAREVTNIITSAKSGALGANDIERMTGLLADISAITECSRGNAKCDVSVKVITKDGTEERKGYKIMAGSYYLADDPTCTQDSRCLHEFRIESSPAVDEFPPARFKIWATKNGKVVSDKKEMYVKRNGVNEFDLSIRVSP